MKILSATVSLILFSLFLSASVSAASLTLTWDKSPDLPGAVMQEYRLYTCAEELFVAPECKVPIAVILHPITEYTIDDPGQGYAILTAVDTDANESDPSNMVNNIAPNAVINFRIILQGTLILE